MYDPISLSKTIKSPLIKQHMKTIAPGISFQIRNAILEGATMTIYVNYKFMSIYVHYKYFER